jgi:hypothetical protein
MEASLLNIKDSTSQDIQCDFYRVQLSSERASYGPAQPYSPSARSQHATAFFHSKLKFTN